MKKLASAELLDGQGQATLRICLLGRFQAGTGSRVIHDQQWRLRKSRAVVKLLALAPQHRLHRDVLVDALWRDRPPDEVAHNLHQVLYIARRALGPGRGENPFLVFQADVLSLGPENLVWIDADAFEQAAQAARRTRKAEVYRDALALYTGDLLPDDRYEEWTEPRRSRLKSLRLTLLVELAGLHERMRDVPAATEAATQALDGDPAQEEAHRILMRIYARSGMRPQALRQYRLLREALQSEVGAEPDAESTSLYQQILAASGEDESWSGPDATPLELSRLPIHPQQPSTPPEQVPIRNNLPLALDSFVGREGAMAEVKQLLAGSRLVTLTGSGGSGKTRLAIRVASDLARDGVPARGEAYGAAGMRFFRDGVVLASFAALLEPALVVPELAGTLDVREQPGQALLPTLCAYLRDKQMLLLFDNCEHLVAACAQMAEALLRACPRLTILTTSREPLRIPGEAAFRVPPLSVPPGHGQAAASSTQPAAAPDPDVLRYEAVRLFADRAVAVRSDFSVGPADASVVAGICARLDGLPLAIELAAARVTSLSVEQIATRLHDRFRLLTGGNRTAVRRQQTLYATIDWSYGLLTEAERMLLRRLSVFAGGWTLESAVAVSMQRETTVVLELLSQLVDKSLVFVEEHEGNVRYGMLNSIREFGSEKLSEAGETSPVRDRHLQFALGLAETAEEKLHGPEHRAWALRMLSENDNLRLALDWSVESGASEPGLRLGSSLWYFWLLRGFWHEGRERLEKSLAVDAGGRTAGSELVGAPGPTATGYARVRAKALNAAGLLARVQGQLDAAQAHYETGLALARQFGDRRNTAWALLGLEAIDELRGNHALARARRTEGLQILRELDDRWDIAWSLGSIGGVALLRDDYQTAGLLFAESLELRRELGDQWGVAWSLNSLAYVALHEQDTPHAWALFAESLGLFGMLHGRRGVAGCLGGMAAVAAAQRSFERAAQLLGAATAALESYNDSLMPADRIAYDRTMALVRTHLVADAYSSAWAAGRALTLGQLERYIVNAQAEFGSSASSAATGQGFK